MVQVAEASRLAALVACGIMDTPRDKLFDRIVFIAAQILRVPLAGLIFVDAHRFWAKAYVGPNRPQGARDGSVYDKAIQTNNLWTVADVTVDPKLAKHSDIFADPPIRFFAAAPVYGSDEQPIGVLCVSDRLSKEIKYRECIILTQLAAQAGELLRLRVIELRLGVR